MLYFDVSLCKEQILSKAKQSNRTTGAVPSAPLSRRCFAETGRNAPTREGELNGYRQVERKGKVLYHDEPVRHVGDELAEDDLVQR